MQKLKNIFNLTNITKVLVIFLVGFIYRIIVYHYFGINVFLDYTNSISILYYFGLFSFSVYFDQLFSYQNSVLTYIDYNIKSFNNDSKTANLLFSKDNSIKDISSIQSSSKNKYVRRNSSYTHAHLRPIVNNRGDIFLVPGLDLSKHSSNSLSSTGNSIPNMPSAPKPSNLSTPSTMSPLFPSSQQNDSLVKSRYSRSPIPFSLSRESQWYTTTDSTVTGINPKPIGDTSISEDNNLRKRHSVRRKTFDTADLSDRRRRIIESVQLKIKESNVSKPHRTTICDKILSGLKYVDSHVISKLDNKPTGILDPEYMKERAERERKVFLYEEAQRRKLYEQEKERMARYYARFGKRK
jgi:hypothetical protein